jgi:hypothetical protein
VRTTRLLSAALSAVLLLTAAACGSDDDSSGDNAGRAVVTTTTTAAAADTTTSTGDATTTTGAPSEFASGPNYVTTEGPSGAGCTPGQTDTLPTGWWAGEITSVGESSIDLDLICFFSGDAATQAAQEDGTQAENDYYVRNANPRTFEIEFPDGTPASCAGLNAEPFACQAADVLTLYRTTDTSDTSILGDTELYPFPLIWVHVTGTTGDYLFMQYTP